jgi:hypothetical protein
LAAAPASAANPAPAAPAADPAAIDPTAATAALNDPTRLMSIGLGSTATGIRKRWTPPAPADLPPIPNLVVEAIIGIGGMGAVYRARQTHLDRVVALKVLDPAHLGDAIFAERFAREARAMARLDHPAIVRLYDYGQTGTYPWLVMELIEGATLREVLRTGNLSAAEALRIAPQLCDALAHAHANGVVHRDLKPENILLDGRGRPKIADFGLAKLHDDVGSLTATGTVMGTAHYMAPEQLAGAASVDHRADLYALGVVIYEMLTGVLPLGRFAPPSQSSGVDVRYDEVVLRSLEREPGRRWQSADDVRRAMDAASEIVPPAAKSAAAAQGSAAQAADARTEKPGDGDEKPKKKNASVHVGPIHVSDDEVRIGDGLVINEDGVRIGDKVVVGNKTVIAPQGGIAVVKDDEPEARGVRALHRDGMLMMICGTVLMIMQVADSPARGMWDNRHAMLWAAAIVMIVGGISLVIRAGRLLVIPGVFAVGAALWLSFPDHVFVVVGLGAMLPFVFGLLFDPPDMERHFRIHRGEHRFLKRVFILAVVAVGYLAAFQPFLRPMPGAFMLPSLQAISPAPAANDPSDVRHIVSDTGSTAQLATWMGPSLPVGPLVRVHVHLRWKDVADQGYLELWTQLADGRRFFTRTLATTGPMRALTGSSDGWQDLILPADASGADSPIAGVELSVVLPGRGTVDIAMPAQIEADPAAAAAVAAQAAADKGAADATAPSAARDRQPEQTNPRSDSRYPLSAAPASSAVEK